MSVSAFAAAHGLPSSNLYEWIRALKGTQTAQERRKSASTQRTSAPVANFAEVSVVGHAARGLTMTIALAGGHTVTLEGGTVDAAWLQSVLKAVRAC
jgi:transposase-like protein